MYSFAPPKSKALEKDLDVVVYLAGDPLGEKKSEEDSSVRDKSSEKQLKMSY